MNRPTKAKNPIKSVKTTFKIVQIIQEKDGAKLSEISDEAGKSKGSVHNHLDTLLEMGYVIKPEDQYEVGVRFLEHGVYARQNREIYDIAKPELERIAADTGELANLMIEENGKGVYLARESGENAVTVDVQTGTQVYLHGTALGKAILAYLPEEEKKWILERHGTPQLTEKTVTDKDKLNSELDQVRKQGIAYDEEERLPGMRCIAVPVLDDREYPVGSLSVAGPIHRMLDEELENKISESLKNTANIIQLNLTYSQ